MAKRKKKSSINLFLFIITVLAAIAAIIFYFSRTRFVRYAAFGIDVPVSYSIHGIDVSHHQSSIDWEDVKAMQIKNIKIGFAFIKATEGINDEDSRFDENWNDAKDAAIPRGAYHFFNAGKSGKAQAENFIETVKLVKGDLPPVLDVEHVNGASKADLQQRVSDWLVMVEAHYHVKPIIYTGADFYTNFLAGRFDDYPLWVAHYLEKDRPRVKRNWTFWQHNEAGHVNGIDAFVDFNVFNGDSTDFKNLMIK